MLLKIAGRAAGGENRFVAWTNGKASLRTRKGLGSRIGFMPATKGK